MGVTKKTRLLVYNKYNKHCAYCGKEIDYNDMQVDHIAPKRNNTHKARTDSIDNLNPSCRRCNHYKRANSIEAYRRLLLLLHERIRQQYICKVAEDYQIIKVAAWDGKFYFETYSEGVE